MFKLGAKRRRTQAEVRESREEARLRQEGLDHQAQQIAELQARLQAVEAENANNEVAANILR